MKRTFRIQVNFEEPIMSKFISFLRFCEYDENYFIMELSGGEHFDLDELLVVK